MILKAPETVSFTTSGFCPGCGHGLAVRLIAEVAEEMNLSEQLLTVLDVACGSLAIDAWKFDTIMAAHGRPIADAIGVKMVRPDHPVLAYIGDGAAYSIGMAEMMHCGLRNDNIIAIVINNNVYGMTGGQCAPTSLPGQKTMSTPYGKDPDRCGMPLQIEKAFSGFKVGYLARGAMCDVPNINKAKKMIKKAFEKSMAGDGFCLVELLSPCPTNLHLSPVANMERITNEVMNYFPIGEFQNNTKEAKQ
ncbi:2-oxoacid:ferredoxin oxidoreductase, beta subunit [Desulfosporosinus orientis DSM 765]|uniref:2-oxoacid:ferredoxin oxidoreductase, beta subunit n=1 Tax=Desulfosporosinus orientis (strain ATCC 19365 / DSM 765 / NCIMB 8382 / VKM B-1628 / Singapore I) TaxID=768706 RepID=G7WB04_DESOD|nr:thiamine pyrophosphate-dependent enzyme [Desulfosporosinus orientis]AET67505.1 2-oxoacid:ferredoxin oxidoreductase, beta subunit [Desulfosporosinus orientis DSM 765]